MFELVALEDIYDGVGTYHAGQRFFVMDQDADMVATLIKQKRAEEYTPRWKGLDWVGATVVIIASGPSLSVRQCEAVLAWSAAVQDKSRRVIVVNTSFRRAPWADAVYGCDGRWWAKYFDEVEQTCTGTFWTQEVIKNEKVNYIKSQPATGLNKQIGVINQGENSGYQAVGLAYQAGAKRIILLGFDMNERGGSHWHGDHPKELNAKPQFASWIKHFESMAKDLKAAGVEVVNCTPGTSLRCFPFMKLEIALGQS